MLDTDGDGLPDGIEQRVYGAMTYDSFLRTVASQTRDGSFAMATSRATFVPGSLHKTDPQNADTDGDDIPDGLDINPTGGAIPAIRLVFETVTVYDPVDAGIGGGEFKLDPYLELDITTVTGTLFPQTPNLPELPITRAGMEVPIADTFELVSDLNDASKTITDVASGEIVVTLAEDITAMLGTIGGGATTTWDEVRFVIKLGDWDICCVGETSGRQDSDNIDIDPESSDSRLPRLSFRLTDTTKAALLRDGDRIINVDASDGRDDPAGDRTTAQDDGKLGLHIVNPIKADFLRNAYAVANDLSATIQYPRVAEYG